MRNALLKDLGVDLEKDIEMTRFYCQEKLIFDTTEVISKLMEKKKVNKTQLADLLGRSKGYVTQLLNGRANMTLRTISNVFVALEAQLNISTSPLNLGFVEDSEYELQDEAQFIVELHVEVLTGTPWSPQVPQDRMVA